MMNNNFWLIQQNTLNGERIATIRSMISVYERRIKRFQEELQILKDLAEEQYKLIEKLGISPTNMLLSPVPVDQNREEEEEEAGKFNLPSYYTKIEIPEFLKSIKSLENSKSKNGKKCKNSKNNISIQKLFDHFPFISSAFFDHNHNNNENNFFNIQPICEHVQTWSQEKRLEFFSETWNCLNSLPFYLNTLFSLLEVDSFQILSESVESILPHSLNYEHAVLYLYDSKSSFLTIEKQKVKLNHILNDGLISTAIKENKSIFIKRSDVNIKDDDLSILVKQKSALIIPIPEVSYVLALFDKVGAFTPFDDIIAKATAEVIMEIGHVIQMRKKMKERVASFQGMSDIFLQLSAVNDTKNFLYVLTKSLIKTFSCSHAQLFKVSQSSEKFWMLSVGAKKTTTFSIGSGIIGYSIAKKSSFSLPRPELSVLFQMESDRPEPNTQVQSILVCPIFDENKSVKWALVLYNKMNANVFSSDDILNIEILCQHFHPLILSCVQTSKLSDEMKVSSRAMEDLSQVVDFISYLSNLSDISAMGSQVTRKMKAMLTIDKTDIYIIDRRSQFIVGTTEDETYINSITKETDDPIIKFSISNQIKEQTTSANSSQSHIYCPLIGLNYNVVGMMVLSSGDQNSVGISQSRSSLLFQSTLSMASSISLITDQQSLILKKLAVLNQRPGNSYSSIANARAKKAFSLWSKIIGNFVELSVANNKVQQMILLEERMLDSLCLLDNSTVTYLYPQIELIFLKKDEIDLVSETKPIANIASNEDLKRNYTNLVSMLSRFPGHCQLLSMKADDQANDDEIPEDFFTKEFPTNNNFDVFSTDEKTISKCILRAMRDLDIISYLHFDNYHVDFCIDCIRRLHLPEKFTNWNLSVDHIQFLVYFLNQTKLIDKFTACQKAALFFYLLSMNCDPITAEDDTIKRRYFLENGSEINVSTSVFIALSSFPESPFFSLDAEEQSLFFRTLESIDQMKEIEVSLTQDLVVLTALICSFSYLARKFEVAQKWVKLRFDEDYISLVEQPQLQQQLQQQQQQQLEIELEQQQQPVSSMDGQSIFEDLVKYQLEFEMRVIIQPAFSEFAKVDIKLDTIRRNFTECLTKITYINF